MMVMMMTMMLVQLFGFISNFDNQAQKAILASTRLKPCGFSVEQHQASRKLGCAILGPSHQSFPF